MSDRYTFFTFKKELCVSQLVSLFYYKSPRNFYFSGEAHDFWEFIYIDKGKMLITAGEKQYILKAGELAFHKPNEFHAVSHYENTLSDFIVSAFVCNDACMQFFEHKIMSLTSRERDYLYEALRHSKRVFTEQQSPFNVAPLYSHDASFAEAQTVQSNLELLLITLIQRGQGVRIQKRVESYLQQTSYRQLTEKVKDYLEAHIEEALTLSQIAENLGYSVSQMKKLFHMQMNCGIMDYFINLKMDEAKRLMQEGQMNITQIALRLGYANTAYFSRLFKQRVEMTPSEYCKSFGGD